MKPEIKKQIILHLPYLAFIYLFGKVGQAFRLAQGADISAKLLHIGQGFSAAFASAAPSFHPTDLLIGLAAAVIIRLVVYSKQKNAKKYRKGMEYGTARWGTAADIKPFIDPVFDNNVLLTATERLMMSNRPKDPKNARNKNILVIGGSGSGKTRFFCKPNIMQLHSSYVITDPKGSLICEVGQLLQRAKYRIAVLNTINFSKSIQPISGEKPIDVQRSAQQQESAAPDAHLTGERVSTPRGSFHVANMTREQMEAAGYGFHHSTDDGKYLIMGNGTQAFAIAADQREQENYMRTAELSTEQNYNMIDGQINNTPSVDELEEKAKRGEVISLSALAAAVKAEDGRTPQRDPDGKKPSIRAQLKADRAQSCKPQQREKEQEAKRSIRQALEME